MCHKRHKQRVLGFRYFVKASRSTQCEGKGGRDDRRNAVGRRTGWSCSSWRSQGVREPVTAQTPPSKSEPDMKFKESLLLMAIAGLSAAPLCAAENPSAEIESLKKQLQQAQDASHRVSTRHSVVAGPGKGRCAADQPSRRPALCPIVYCTHPWNCTAAGTSGAGCRRAPCCWLSPWYRREGGPACSQSPAGGHRATGGGARSRHRVGERAKLVGGAWW